MFVIVNSGAVRIWNLRKLKRAVLIDSARAVLLNIDRVEFGPNSDLHTHRGTEVGYSFPIDRGARQPRRRSSEDRKQGNWIGVRVLERDPDDAAELA
jgi:hypothetical protein